MKTTTLYLHPKQIAGEYITGTEVYQHLKDTDRLKDCATLADLEEYANGNKEIPKEWKGKFIYAWGSVKYRNDDSDLIVRYLDCHRIQPYVDWFILGGDWYNYEPALLLVDDTKEGDSLVLDKDDPLLAKYIESEVPTRPSVDNVNIQRAWFDRLVAIQQKYEDNPSSENLSMLLGYLSSAKFIKNNL